MSGSIVFPSTLSIYYYTMQSAWEDVWHNAQSSLASLRGSLSSENSPEPRIIRVGQLDSELLDQELVSLLQDPLNAAIALINVCSLLIYIQTLAEIGTVLAAIAQVSVRARVNPAYSVNSLQIINMEYRCFVWGQASGPSICYT